MAFSKLEWFKKAVLGSTDLTHGDRSVLMVFFSYSDGSGQNARPGRQRIMDDACVSRSKLDGHLKKLLDLGYIVLTEKGGNEVKKGWANVYRLGVPLRLTQSTRGTAEGTLRNPQGPPPRNEGAPSGDEGAPSGDTRGTLTVLEGAPSGGPHQVIDQVIDQGIDQVIGALDSSSSSDRQTNRRPFNLADDARQDLITCIQFVAERLGPGYSSEEHEVAEAALLECIDTYIGEEARDLWEHEWKVTMPQIEAPSAEQKLDQFIGHCVLTGYPIEAMKKVS